MGMAPPDPVFFCSVEPPSISQQKQLETALSNLKREDPSLRVRFDEETGQTILEGMLDIVIFTGWYDSDKVDSISTRMDFIKWQKTYKDYKVKQEEI